MTCTKFRSNSPKLFKDTAFRPVPCHQISWCVIPKWDIRSLLTTFDQHGIRIIWPQFWDYLIKDVWGVYKCKRDFELLCFSSSGLHRTSRSCRTARTGGGKSEFKWTIIQSSFLNNANEMWESRRCHLHEWKQDSMLSNTTENLFESYLSLYDHGSMFYSSALTMDI